MRGKVKALSLAAKVILVLVCLVLFIPSILRFCPFLVGADGVFTVLGGSMEPALRIGDMAFTVEVDASEVAVGDVVAVRTDSEVYMHRVVEKKVSEEGSLFKLKGDANEVPDSCYVESSEIIGQTLFFLPTGYICTRYGYLLVVTTPLMLLAAYQAIKIYNIYDPQKKKRRGLMAIFLGKGGKRKRNTPILDATSALLLLILVAGVTHMMVPYFISGTGSFFIDTKASSNNIFKVATWRVESSITCTVTPSTISLGGNIAVSGSVNPARSGVPVTLTFEREDTTPLTQTVTVTTDDAGFYEYVYTPAEVGSWHVQACWEGDSDYYGATSEKAFFTVQEAVVGD